MRIEMKVSGLALDPFTNLPILILKDAAGSQALPIWIGQVEAGAIASQLGDVRLARPTTHDLLKDILGQVGIRVDRVEVDDVRHDTYYASIYLDRGGQLLRVQARPSDAIAIALRTGAPIHVASKVIEKTRQIEIDSEWMAAAGQEASSDLADLAEPDEAGGDGERFRRLLEGLPQREFGKWKM